jgi:hypothetical protein
VGECWTLLVVRELLLGPKLFTELRAGLPGVSPNVLAQRLRELEWAGIVQPRELAEALRFGEVKTLTLISERLKRLLEPPLKPEAPASYAKR